MTDRYSMRWLMPIAALVAAPASAVTYLSVEESQALFFPNQSMQSQIVELSKEQVKLIEKQAGTKVRNKTVKLWRSANGGWFYVDQVIGKHEFITYALALTAEGNVAGIEILDYRETYGGEIRNPKWRAQFNGKHNGSALKLDVDIVNLSGATLSCRNVTLGVKRLLATHELLF